MKVRKALPKGLIAKDEKIVKFFTDHNAAGTVLDLDEPEIKIAEDIMRDIIRRSVWRSFKSALEKM